MKVYSLQNKPDALIEMRKTGTIHAVQIKEPFQIETQEGILTMSPEQCDDWGDGYYIAFPSDGSKPYGIAPKYMEENYEKVGANS